MAHNGSDAPTITSEDYYLAMLAAVTEARKRDDFTARLDAIIRSLPASPVRDTRHLSR